MPCVRFWHGSWEKRLQHREKSVPNRKSHATSTAIRSRHQKQRSDPERGESRVCSAGCSAAAARRLERSRAAQSALREPVDRTSIRVFVSVYRVDSKHKDTRKLKKISTAKLYISALNRRKYGRSRSRAYDSTILLFSSIRNAVSRRGQRPGPSALGRNHSKLCCRVYSMLWYSGGRRRPL